jgi:hypothetical protein
MSIEYRRQMQEWKRSLSPNEQEAARAEARANGFRGDIFEPVDEYARGNCTGYDHDAGEDARVIEPIPTEDAPQTHHDSLEALHRALLAVKESTSPRRTVDALIFAFGFNSHMGESCTSLASRYGVTKAAFSNMARKIVTRYGIHPSGSMKTEQAVQRYKLTNKPRTKS